MKDIDKIYFQKCVDSIDWENVLIFTVIFVILIVALGWYSILAFIFINFIKSIG